MKADRCVERLPKWAQSELLRLERELEHVKAQLAAGPDDSNTFADAYNDTPRPLGDCPSIEFRFPGMSVWGKCRIIARIEGDSLMVMGNDSITVRPQSSNLVRIKLERP